MQPKHKFAFDIEPMKFGSLIVRLACPSLGIQEEILIVPAQFGLVLRAKHNSDAARPTTERVIGQFGNDEATYLFISGQQPECEGESPAQQNLTEMAEAMMSMPDDMAILLLATNLVAGQTTAEALADAPVPAPEASCPNEITEFLAGLNLDGI